MAKSIKYPVCILAALLGAVLMFFIISFVVEHRPEPVEPVTEYFGSDGCDNPSALPDTLRIVSWNIGYAGLGDNMDFCVDGGQMVRDSKERSDSNLVGIIERLRSFDADVMILQEVDKKAHRTYGVDQIKEIAGAFPGYLAYYAPNFKVWFVPSPLKEPIGSVDAGLVILTRIKPEAVRRIQYPSKFPFPVSMFNLKRCILEADFKTADGRTFHLGNSHCTAFDTGGMRTVENKFLKSMLSAYSADGELFVVGGDWNQYPPEYTPGQAELENEFFVPEKFDTCGLNSYAGVVCDAGKYSARFNDAPYGPSSTRTLLDFFVVSNPGIGVLSVNVVDLDFHNSDHNPVVMDLEL